MELHTNLFEIVPVQLVACGTDNTVHCRKQKNSEYQKRKRCIKTEKFQRKLIMREKKDLRKKGSPKKESN